MSRRVKLLSSAVVGLAASWAVMADSITPGSVTATIDVGTTLTINKTVTVSAGTPTSSKVDVYFLADTTGSMGGTIAAVRASAGSILSQTAGLGDVAFAVGEYKDFGDSYVFRMNQNITTVQANAQAGINMWGASGGGDYAEANLYALNKVANDTSWRPASERILVWFGDAPGHDPSGGVTEAAATAALNAQGIAAQAINVAPTSWDFELPAGGNNYGLNDTGQAQRIANATGGTLYSGIDSSSIVDTIKNAITVAVSTYNTVGLDLSAVPAGLTAVSTPVNYSGSYDRSAERTFTFTVQITGNSEGTYTFPINALVDGGAVATEKDDITVRKSSGVPDPGSTLVLLGMAMSALVSLRRIRR